MSWREYLFAAVVAALGLLGIALQSERLATEKAAREQAEKAAEQAAQTLATERAQQEKVNAALRQQNEDLAGINAGLLSDLERLRNRPARVPQAAGSACKGATGAELSGPDSSFLVRLAARADRQRAALAACYEYVDAE